MSKATPAEIQQKQFRDLISKGKISDVEEMIEAARKSGASDLEALLECKDKAGRTPLLLAIRAKRHDLARILIKADAKTDAHDLKGNCGYVYATKNRDIRIVRLLSDAGAKPPSWILYPLTNNNEDETSIELMSRLLEAGAIPQHTPAIHKSFMSIQFTVKNVHALAAAISITRNTKHETLYYAHEAFFNLMVEKVADLNWQNPKTGESFLHIATTSSMSEFHKGQYKRIIRKLLDQGIDTTLRDKKGRLASDYRLPAEISEMLDDYTTGRLKPAAIEAKNAATETKAISGQKDTWTVLGDHIVEHSVLDDTGLQELTVVFNFRARNCMTIRRDLGRPDEQPATMLESMQDFANPEYLEEAKTRMRGAGKAIQQENAGTVVKRRI